MLLRRALHARGAVSTAPKLAKGCTPDIVLPGRRVAVFVDGDFWHGCPRPLPRPPPRRPKRHVCGSRSSLPRPSVTRVPRDWLRRPDGRSSGSGNARFVSRLRLLRPCAGSIPRSEHMFDDTPAESRDLSASGA